MRRAPFIFTVDTTRAELQQEIEKLRHLQRTAVIPSTADEYADEADALLEVWLLCVPDSA